MIRNKLLNKYVFQTGWLLADKVLRLTLGFIVSVYVTRYLGPKQFGVLSFAVSFVALFGFLGRLGLDNIVVRNLVQNEGPQDELLGTAFILRFIGSVFLVVAVWASLCFVGSDHLTKMIVMIIAIGYFFQFTDVTESYFFAKIRARAIAFAGIGSLFVSSICKIVLIYLRAPLYCFAWVYVLEVSVKGMLLSVLYLRDAFSMNWYFNFARASKMLKDSWPLILSGLVIMVYMRIDQVMIKLMLNDVSVGVYAAAVRLSEAWYFIPMIITQSLFPAIIESKKRSYDEYRIKMQRLYDYMVLLGVSAAIVITFLGHWIVNFIYGYNFIQAASVLSIHVWAGVFVCLGVASSKWFLIENLQAISALNTALGAIVNIVLNYVLIPVLGIKGAAVSTVISYGVAVYLSGYVHSSTKSNFYALTRSLNLMRCVKGVRAWLICRKNS